MGILLYNESCKDIIIQFIKLFRHFLKMYPEMVSFAVVYRQAHLIIILYRIFL